MIILHWGIKFNDYQPVAVKLLSNSKTHSQNSQYQKMHRIKQIVHKLILLSTLSIISKHQAKTQKCPWFLIHRCKIKRNSNNRSVMKKIQKITDQHRMGIIIQTQIHGYQTSYCYNYTRYHKNLGSVCIFFFRASIIQIIANTSASVNMILFQFGSKNCFVVNRSKETSEITPNTNKVTRYLALLLVLKKPSTSKNAKIGNAILPIMSNMLLTVFNRPPFKFG